MGLQKSAGLTTVTVTHDIEVAVVMGRKILALGDGPNREARVIENESACGAEANRSQAFQEKCTELRHLLDKLI